MSDKKNRLDSVSLSDLVKRVVSVGVGAGFMTEEAVSKILQDIPLPKDIVQGLLNNAKQAKIDFVGSLQGEFKNYLKEAEPERLLDHLLENYDVEVKASFKFKKKRKTSSKKS